MRDIRSRYFGYALSGVFLWIINSITIEKWDCTMTIRYLFESVIRIRILSYFGFVNSFKLHEKILRKHWSYTFIIRSKPGTRCPVCPNTCNGDVWSRNTVFYIERQSSRIWSDKMWLHCYPFKKLFGEVELLRHPWWRLP